MAVRKNDREELTIGLAILVLEHATVDSYGHLNLACRALKSA